MIGPPFLRGNFNGKGKKEGIELIKHALWVAL
jgi:hypothetical protein